MIVPDVPVEAQQLPQARELACARLTAYRFGARCALGLAFASSSRGPGARQSLVGHLTGCGAESHGLCCANLRGRPGGRPNSGGADTPRPARCGGCGASRLDWCANGNQHVLRRRTEWKPVPARTPGGGTWSQSAPVPPTRVAHDAAASHSTCSQTACCRVRSHAHAGRSCPSPARRRRSGVHRKVFGCPCHYRRSTSIRSRTFGVGQSRAAPLLRGHRCRR